MRLRAQFGKGLRRAWLRFAALAIGCQFLVPTGYMPGSFANGTPFMLCDMYTSVPEHRSAPNSEAVHEMGSMHAEMPDMASHSPSTGEHEEHLGADAWENCPLGALGASAALAFSIEPAIEPAGPDQISTSLAALPSSISILTARARAPPATAIQLIV